MLLASGSFIVAAVLRGIISDPDGSLAVVRTATNKDSRVRVGDNIEGWTVASIDDLRLVMSRDDRMVSFELFERPRNRPAEGPIIAPAVGPVIDRAMGANATAPNGATIAPAMGPNIAPAIGPVIAPVRGPAPDIGRIARTRDRPKIN
jgi:hypothetical protein